ncbi:MAG: hypothetical protein UR52_C0001G0096 [Candidatus Gottesmanbacteria bacterium GW2011_GWA1_34_13]|uniref:NAD-dependent epimerase/dehydratase domain-containing protein n=1 Tax=Candidatus Gottesmanbacteria bacterium GW2011_GWA1_34_13 TaxID=1618434 RepID=A0A0G0B8I7_9BACT|nr:MAG: hypothetical protein UR52_C0001G0096 [Candidatus Gottesmanbacteria bacterium GW2011_GWA1_34_13]
MKILVTGGAGFIGSHIVDSYVKLGHQVIVIDNLITGRLKNLNPKAKFYQIDITNRQEVARLFDTEKPEILNHHAAQMDVRKSVEDPIFDAQTNILGFLNLMEEGRKNGLKKVIFASTGGAIYGDANIIPTPEIYLTNPVSPYGISKLTTEHYLYYYNWLYKINFCVLRYSNVYGPRQNPHGEAGVIAIFIKKMLNNEQPIINGDGTQIRDFVYVLDVVTANVSALNISQPIIVNIGTGIGTNLNVLFDELNQAAHLRFNKIYGPGKLGEQKTSTLDATNASKILNWKPRYDLKQGLLETVNFFKNG